MDEYNDEDFSDWSRESPIYVHRAPRAGKPDWLRRTLWGIALTVALSMAAIYVHGVYSAWREIFG